MVIGDFLCVAHYILPDEGPFEDGCLDQKLKQKWQLRQQEGLLELTSSWRSDFVPMK